MGFKMKYKLIENNIIVNTAVFDDPELASMLGYVVADSDDGIYSTIEIVEKSYSELRAAEYPPITDYIDGVVKGDQAQIDAYIAACLAVKSKYPKD